MKFNVESSGLTIGLNNSITEALKTKKFGTRLSFSDDNHYSRFEVVLNETEAKLLLKKIQESLELNEHAKTHVLLGN